MSFSVVGLRSNFLLFHREVETFDQKSDATENPDEDEDTGERLVENFEKEQTLYEECEEANARTNEVLGECSGEADLYAYCLRLSAAQSEKYWIYVNRETDVPLHPAVFRSVLRPYQLQGVRWMLEHETLSIATEEFSQKYSSFWRLTTNATPLSYDCCLLR